MSEIVLALNQGEVSSRDSSALNDGELKKTVGCQYLPGDTDRIWKVQGRTLFGATGASTKIRGMALCKFDSGGQDKLIALTGSSIFAATPGATGTFSSLTGGRSQVSSHLSAAHYLDRWYLTTGADHNSVLESDGTFRNMGMVAPQQAPIVAAAATSATASRPTTLSGSNTGISDEGNAYDSDEETFATVTLQAEATKIGTFSGWSSSTASNRRMIVKWFLAERQFTIPDRDFGDRPGVSDAGFRVNIKFEKSEDAGDTWSTFMNVSLRAGMTQLQQITVSIDGGGTSVNSQNVRFRYTYEYQRGTSVGTLRIYDIKILDGSEASPVDASALIYAVCEFDETRGIRSPLSPLSKSVALVSLSGHNQVNITLPTQQNSNSTHWILYRTPDGGVAPQQLGEVAVFDIDETTAIDDFSLFPTTEQPLPVAALKMIFSDDSADPDAELVFDRDRPPPLLEHITAFAGRLVGFSGRSMYYSEPGLPESWPSINVVSSFPMPERDELVAGIQIGDQLLVGATELMFVLDTLPDIIGNRLVATPPRQLSGQPGLTSPKAITPFSISGEPRAAWVSRFGIHQTNGSLSEWLTKDIDWNSKVDASTLSDAVLMWDRSRQCLVFAYDTPSGSRRWALIHMSPEHRKQNGMPKITWDHYGEIGAMVAGEVDGVYRVYSGHNSNGNVYLEDSGNTDASNAYDSGGNIPMEVDLGDKYAQWSEFGVNKGNIRHGDAGSGQSVALTVTMKRDSSGNAQSVTKTVSMAGDKGTEFLVSRAGERLSLSLVHTGQSRLSLRDVRLDVEPMGAAGRVR